jgi:membrane protease YdiL (CAAX protease family)
MFGVAHLYQGWIGVIATTLAGLLFTGVYLATGNIWIAALLHSLLNLQALWLRPLLRERRTGKV